MRIMDWNLFKEAALTEGGAFSLSVQAQPSVEQLHYRCLIAMHLPVVMRDTVCVAWPEYLLVDHPYTGVLPDYPQAARRFW